MVFYIIQIIELSQNALLYLMLKFKLPWSNHNFIKAACLFIDKYL